MKFIQECSKVCKRYADFIRRLALFDELYEKRRFDRLLFCYLVGKFRKTFGKAFAVYAHGFA